MPHLAVSATARLPGKAAAASSAVTTLSGLWGGEEKALEGTARVPRIRA